MRSVLLALFLLFTFSVTSNAQEVKLSSETLSGIKFRNIGPAYMSGRVSDIAINPSNYAEWYVAIGSGGIWKTSNAGITWKPIFDGQKVYSIGCITIDPSNNNIIWAGSGENVGGRHLSYGDGVYKSEDGGKSWKNVGLPKSEHISKIIVHPTNSNIVWLASQGPLWSKGGERGVYKTTDGGKTWRNVLSIDEWTGATDLLIDPTDPSTLYAATWQKHRNVAAYMGGGPGTSIYKSSDFGNTWQKIDKGLSSSDKGKIGIAISPQNPNVLYAAVELERRKGAIYKSTDKGASWVKQSDVVSGGTGPHYYQELYADPHTFDKIYLADVRMKISEDGGKTFKTMKERAKHSDNHALAFRANDPNYLLVGTDGGLYESYDNTQNWRFIDNLPITQYYKLAVDDSEPFYNIYGGTQDNSTQVGPSRTDNVTGIRNSDWELTLFADGHQPATEPGNPNIAYSEWQEGNLMRIDRKTGEQVYIKPQPAKGEATERYNWDAPILVSPHKPSRLYFASQRVWKSEDRGDSWTPISKDLTLNQNRYQLDIMGQTWGWDSAWDTYAMSQYNTITSVSESPVKEGVLCVGTDDGRIQITDDGGANWKLVEVSKLPSCPETAFVNDIKFDQFDANTIYVSLDNHKYGDYTPYFYKSTNLGRSWKKMTNGIQEGSMVWRFVQDHKQKNLMFLATEFGIYVSVDAADNWVKLKGGLPTISFRDLAIQKREDDLVAASFGRGFFILDDLSFLRSVSDQQTASEASLFQPRKAWWYIPRAGIAFNKRGSSGVSDYIAPNPEFGSTFTYYLKDSYKSLAQQRKAAEKQLKKDGKPIKFPEWDDINKELAEKKPIVWLTISDSEGNIIRKLEVPNKKGFNRFTWDLCYPSLGYINKVNPKAKKNASGMMVAPGTYTAVLSKDVSGVVSDISQPVEVVIERLREGSLETGASPEEVAKFWQNTQTTFAEYRKLRSDIDKAKKKVEKLTLSFKYSDAKPGTIDKKIEESRQSLIKLEAKYNGPQAQGELEYSPFPSIGDRLSVASTGNRRSTYGPTPTHIENFEIAKEMITECSKELKKIIEEQINPIQKELEAINAPKVD